MSIAEGNPDFKVDVNLVLDNKVKSKKNVLRTTLDSVGMWKTKHSIPQSRFTRNIEGKTKFAAIIDKELWVFGIDATNASDIFTAVNIAKEYYKVSASDIISDVYVKNLNIEGEHDMEDQAKISANKKLYAAVSNAIVDAARNLGVQGAINFWVFSNSKNHKIPKEDLHQSLRDGGANSVTTDDKTKYKFWVGNNDGTGAQKFKTNLHLATFNL